MHPNSIDAHRNNIELNSYRNMSERIISEIQFLGKATMHEVADKLGVQLSRVSGRFGELVKKEKIEIIGSVKIGKYSYSIYTVK